MPTPAQASGLPWRRRSHRPQQPGELINYLTQMSFSLSLLSSCGLISLESPGSVGGGGSQLWPHCTAGGVPFLVPRGWFCLAADLSAIFQLQGWACAESSLGGSPGGPVVGTLRFHCGGRGFHPFEGTKIPPATQCGQKKPHHQQSQSWGSGCGKSWFWGERSHPAQLQKPRASPLRLLRL